MKVFSEDNALQLAERLLQNDKDIKTELEGKINSIDISGDEYDDTELVERIENLEEEIGDKADKSEIPSVEGLATETFVTNAIANAQLSGGGNIDLSGYVKTDDLDEYVTETEMNSAIANIQSMSINYDEINKSIIFN